ncbi:MAG: hypothetical protein ACFFAO_19715 [Candidatus Hermodarchaeota archaeon]
MFIQDQYIRIKNKGRYNGCIGRIVSFNGFKYYKIKLLNEKKEIYCDQNQLEYANESDVRKHMFILKIDDKTKLIIKDQNLKPFVSILDKNDRFKGLYALGKYYSRSHYYSRHNLDYLSKKIIELKNLNHETADIIEKMFHYFIENFNSLKKIISKINYVVMMPSIKPTNHVGLWGRRLISKLKKNDLSEFISIPSEKKYIFVDYKSYKYPKRAELIRGAFKINKDKKKFPNLHSRSCLILDDVCTSGNHINELTNILVEEGLKEAYAFVIGLTKPKPIKT